MLLGRFSLRLKYTPKQMNPSKKFIFFDDYPNAKKQYNPTGTSADERIQWLAENATKTKKILWTL